MFTQQIMACFYINAVNIKCSTFNNIKYLGLFIIQNVQCSLEYGRTFKKIKLYCLI